MAHAFRPKINTLIVRKGHYSSLRGPSNRRFGFQLRVGSRAGPPVVDFPLFKRRLWSSPRRCGCVPVSPLGDGRYEALLEAMYRSARNPPIAFCDRPYWRY